MVFEHKNGRGSVWKNEKYTKGDNKPLLKGTCKTPDGVLCELAIWAQAEMPIEVFEFMGKEYFSVQLSPPYKQAVAPPEMEPEDEETIDDLPF